MGRNLVLNSTQPRLALCLSIQNAMITGTYYHAWLIKICTWVCGLCMWLQVPKKEGIRSIRSPGAGVTVSWEPVSCLAWVLGTELLSSRRASRARNHGAISPTLHAGHFSFSHIQFNSYPRDERDVNFPCNFVSANLSDIGYLAPSTVFKSLIKGKKNFEVRYHYVA